jgi:hypothetical protein
MPFRFAPVGKPNGFHGFNGRMMRCLRGNACGWRHRTWCMINHQDLLWHNCDIVFWMALERLYESLWWFSVIPLRVPFQIHPGWGIDALFDDPPKTAAPCWPGAAIPDAGLFVATAGVWSCWRLSWMGPKMIRHAPLPNHGLHMGVSENSVPLNPMVNDHYPY